MKILTVQLSLVSLVSLAASVRMVAAQPAKVYWAQAVDDRISRSNIDGTSAELLLAFPQTNGIIGFAVDSVERKVYWAQSFEDRIRRADLDGTNVETLVAFPEVSGVIAIALDLVGRKVYWAQAFDDRIMRANLDGTNAEPILEFPEVFDVVDLQIDSNGGKLYWAEGADDKIRRANLDGTSMKDILGFPVVSGIVAIAIDSQAGQVYWAQRFNERIRKTDFTGAVFETVLETPVTGDIVDLVVGPGEDAMFWLQADDTLQRASLGGAGVQTLAEWPDLNQPLAVTFANSTPACTSSICPPPAPHDMRKNRYISVDARGVNNANVGQSFDIQLTLTNTLVNGVVAVGSVWWANAPDANCLSVVGPTQPAVPINWDTCPTLHLTGCPIIPTSIYEIVAVVGGSAAGPPLLGETQLLPTDNKWWGDAVSFYDGTKWGPPQGVMNFDDVTAALRTFQGPTAVNATHVSVTDVHPNLPTLPPPGNQINKLVNVDDVFQFIQAFQGAEYPGPEIELCSDP